MPNEQENTPQNETDNTFNAPQEPTTSQVSSMQSRPTSFQSSGSSDNSAATNQAFAAPAEVEPSTVSPVSSPFTQQPDTYAPAFPASSSLPITPNKSKKNLIIAGIVAGVLTLFLGGGAAAYNLWYQNPDKVIGDALGNALSAKSVSTDSTITSKSEFGTSSSTSDFKIKTLSNETDARADVSFDSDMDGRKYGLSGSVVLKNNEKLYFKIDKLKESLEQSGLLAYIGSTPSVTALIDKIDGNWIVLDDEYLEEVTGSEDDASKCIEDVMKKFKTDKEYSKDIKQLYMEFPLMGVKDKLASKDGSLGYEIEFMRENAIKFTNGINSTKFYKDLKTCDDKIEDLDGEEIFKEDTSDESKSETKVVVWIDRWSHQFTKLEVTGKSEDSSGSLVSNMKFNVPVKIDEPSDAITIEELQSDFEAIQQESMQAYEASVIESDRLNDETNNAGSMGAVSDSINFRELAEKLITQ